MNKLNILLERLKKIGINVTVFSNYPWIYIDRINGKRVLEKFRSEHAFTIGYHPIRVGDEVKLVNETEKIFEIIRKYR